MKTIVLAFISTLGLFTAQTKSEPAKNEFSMVIEGVKCQVKAYKATSPIIFEPMVDKDFRPKSQLMLAIMLTKSDISCYMSDREIIEVGGVTFNEEAAQKLRSVMKKWFEPIGPSGADNPWKGTKFVVDQAFVVESENGKFLVYQSSTQGGKNIGGNYCDSMKNVAGKWTIGGEKSETGQQFQLSMLKLIPAEFAKLHEASSINPQSMDVLLQ